MEGTGVITLPDLYDHQNDHKDATKAALAKHKRVILNAPTGCGKTRISKWILASSANRPQLENQSGNSLFTVHRRGLVDNAIDSFAEEPSLPHGIIMSGRETSYGCRIQVASIDTLLSWFVEDNDYPSDLTFDLIVWDEAHSHHSKLATFLKYHDRKRETLGLHPAYVIGLTATPQAEGLSDVYNEIVQGPTTQWLIDNEYLSPFRYYQATQGKLDKLVKRGGEFTTKSVAEAMDNLAGDLVRDWQKFAENRPTVGFFPRRAHAKAAAAQLEAAGLRVAYVDGETPDDERRSAFGALGRHYIDYLCNVQIVERGTDIPRISCVQLCVAVGSIVRYRQMIGRGSRCHPDKTDCLVIDHGGNVLRHGFFEDDPEWNLDHRTKKTGEVGARPTVECPNCQAIYRGGECPSCGYTPTDHERKIQGLIFDGSELSEIKREKKSTATQTAESLMISAIYQAGHCGLSWKQAVGIYKTMNRKQGTNHYVPRTVTVGQHRYDMIQYGSKDAGRNVGILYPFVHGQHGGDYLIPPNNSTSEAPY